MESSSFLSSANSSGSFDNERNDTPQLEEKISELTAENENLKMQFEALIQQSKQMNDLCEKIKALSKQNHELSAVNEDIQHRLELSLRKNQELNQLYEEEKKKSSNNQPQLPLIKQQDYDDIKQQYQKEIDELHKTISTIQEQNHNLQVEQKTMANKIERTINTASRMFKTTLNSIDGLNQFLSQQTFSTFNQKQYVNQQPQERGIEDPSIRYEELISIMKEKLKNMKRDNEELQISNNNLKQKSKDLIKSNNDDLNELKRKHKTEISEITTKFNKEKKNLNNTITSLKQEIEKMKEEIVEVKSLPPKVIKETIIDTKKLNEQKNKYENQISQLTSQIKQQECQNKELEDEKNDLLNKLSQINKDNSFLLTQVSNNGTRIKSLESTIEENNKVIESLRQTLHTRNPIEVQPAETQRSQADKLKIEHLKKKNEELEKKQSEIQNKLNQLNDAIFDLKKENTELESKNQWMEAQDKKHMKDIEELQQQIDKFKSHASEREIIPQEIWTTTKFGPHVAKQIENIAVNSALQPASKIRNIYDIISSQFKSLETNTENQVNQCVKKLSEIKDKLSNFILDASVALLDRPITFDDIISNNGSEEIVNGINRLRDVKDELQHKDEYLSNLVDSIKEQLFVNDINDIMPHINQIIEDKIEQDEELSILHMKYKQAKESIKDLLRKMKERESEFDTEIESIQNHLGSLKEENKELEEKYNNSKQEANDANEEIEKLKEIIEDQKREITSGGLKQTTCLREANKPSQQLINTNDNSIQQLEEENSELLQQIQKLKEENQNLIQENEQIKSRFEKYQQSMNEMIESERNNYKSEKENAQAIYQATIDQLKKQCEDNREDIQKLSLSNSQAESFIATTKATINKLNASKRKIENEFRLYKQQAERQELITNASNNAKLSSMGIKHQTEIEQMRNDFEKEKRNIYSSFAMKFSSYYNPSSSLNERTYNAIINNVYQDLTKLKSSDSTIRNMLHANSGQTTEDAVAQIIYKE